MRKYSLAGICLLVCLSFLLSACAASGSSFSDISDSNNDRTAGDTASQATSEQTATAASGSQVSGDSRDMDYDVAEMNIDYGNGSIYGRLYVPEDPSETLVILSYGFGGSYRNVEDYALNFAENGISAFAFDFTGGGSGSRSGGSTTEMSVLTEAGDLNNVIDHFKNDTEHHYERIFLLGESQGGFVSTYVAGTRPDDITGLIVLYPAYVLQDDSRERNPDPENGPDTTSLMGIPIGRIYDIDAQSFDIYDVMSRYPGKVLIIHGTSDSIAPISYSERAAETFPDAELVKIEGAGHGFYGSSEQQAEELSVQFVKENESLSESSQEAETYVQSAEDSVEETSMTMMIGDTSVQVEWEDNESVRALKELASEEPLTIQMSIYGGFEQVGSIGTALPRNDEQTTTSPGDIVLYSGDQIVVFYGSNSWAYTRLGKITNQTEENMAQLLGNGDVTITLKD